MRQLVARMGSSGHFAAIPYPSPTFDAAPGWTLPTIA